MIERNIVVGLDCGASHTSVSVWKNEENIFSKSDWPGVNPDVVDFRVATEKLSPFIAELASFQNAKWVVGMAGVDNKTEMTEVNSWFNELLVSSKIQVSKYIVFSDIELVLWAGGNRGAGIGIIAGTGSNCLGRNVFGESLKVGGMSHILSDEGGGFSLGWKCLHLVTKMLDGRAERTELAMEVMTLYGCTDLVGLKNLLVKSENMKVIVARSAKTLLAAADRGDADARRICTEESMELVQMVCAINSGLRSDSPLPTFLAGSIFRNANFLDLFKEGLSKFSPSQEVRLVTPIEGALVFANSVP